MHRDRHFRLLALLILPALLASCAAPSDTESPSGDESASTATAEEEFIPARTPVPTTEPDLLSNAITEFAASTGLANERVLGLTGEQWIDVGVSILVIIGVYTVGSLLIRLLLPRISNRVPAPYDGQIKKYIGGALRRLALVYSIYLAINRLVLVSSGLKHTANDMLFVFALILGTQIGLKSINLIQAYYVERLEPPERRSELGPVMLLVARIAYAVTLVVALSIGLAHFGINIAALAAALGIAGLGLALAAQDTIADAIAGMLILADRPFRIGDRIEIESINTWGDVVDIGLRTTRIRTRDNRVVIIPNSTISKNEVINYSYPDPTYRIETHVGVGYGEDLEKARTIMIESVKGVEGVLLDKPVEALYIEMADSEMKFRVRWWIESYVDTRRMFDKIHTALQNALDEAGLYQPYPIQELHHQLTPDQERLIGASPRVRETRRKPRASNSPGEDGGSDLSD